jgi:hypothetical protein
MLKGFPTKSLIVALVWSTECHTLVLSLDGRSLNTEGLLDTGQDEVELFWVTVLNVFSIVITVRPLCKKVCF